MARSVRIKDHQAEQRMFARRAIICAVLMTLAFGTLIARLVWLQVVRYDYFAALSQGNRVRIEPIPPNRGLVLDRNGIPLALNVPSYQLELTREQVPDLDGTLRALANLYLLDREDVPLLKREIMGRRSFEAVPLKLQMSDEELGRFAVRRFEFPGVEIRPRLTRFYPLKESGVHALGYVGAISEDDQKRIDMNQYAGTTLIGKSGVERKYESELHGQTGYQQILVNAQGRRVERLGRTIPELKRREAVAGNDLYLSINENLQNAAEEALRGWRAAAVAINPANGDVLAFVSTPGFDPNLFVRGISRTQYRELADDIDRPMYDRVLRGLYPSGSTIKPFMAMTALQYNVLTPEDRRYCRGFFTLPGSSHRYRDWKPQGHGSMDMRGAIQHSCDVYFYGAAELLGIDHIHDFLSEFGFGEPTGIDIDGEMRGLLPSTAWKRKAYKRKELQIWFPGETIITGIGQGYLLVTPLQLAHATASLSMHGQRFQPRLVHAVRDSVTGKVRELPPVPLPPVQARDPGMWDVIVEGMQMVMKPGGTASIAGNGTAYTMAGKTGTAQVFSVGQNESYKKMHVEERLKDHGLFVAFAPVEKPVIALAVVMENGSHGTAAAAIARRILDVYLLPPDVLAAQDAKKQQGKARPDAAAPAAAAPPLKPAAQGDE